MNLCKETIIQRENMMPDHESRVFRSIRQLFPEQQDDLVGLELALVEMARSKDTMEIFLKNVHVDTHVGMKRSMTCPEDDFLSNLALLFMKRQGMGVPSLTSTGNDILVRIAEKEMVMSLQMLASRWWSGLKNTLDVNIASKSAKIPMVYAVPWPLFPEICVGRKLCLTQLPLVISLLEKNPDYRNLCQVLKCITANIYLDLQKEEMTQRSMSIASCDTILDPNRRRNIHEVITRLWRANPLSQMIYSSKDYWWNWGWKQMSQETSLGVSSVLTFTWDALSCFVDSFLIAALQMMGRIQTCDNTYDDSLSLLYNIHTRLEKASTQSERDALRDQFWAWLVEKGYPDFICQRGHSVGSILNVCQIFFDHLHPSRVSDSPNVGILSIEKSQLEVWKSSHTVAESKRRVRCWNSLFFDTDTLKSEKHPVTLSSIPIKTTVVPSYVCVYAHGGYLAPDLCIENMFGLKYPSTRHKLFAITYHDPQGSGHYTTDFCHYADNCWYSSDGFSPHASSISHPDPMKIMTSASLLWYHSVSPSGFQVQ
jgi:hypothetical protein